MEVKRCSDCGAEKLINQFYKKDTSSPFKSQQRQSICIQCWPQWRKNYRSKADLKRRFVEEQRRAIEEARA